MAGKKASRPRTPADKSEAEKRTAKRKTQNMTRNDDQHQLNAQEVDPALSTLTPKPRDGREGNPRSNRGNGSPTRLSQIRRALSRVDKPRSA